MELSVVLTCRAALRIARAIRSIDAPAEVLVVLNGSPPGFERALLREFGDRIRIERLPTPNRAGSAEHGIRAAGHDRVFLMDSDCVAEPGSIAAVARAFACGRPEAEVYKGRILYEPGDSFVSAVLARSRTQRNRRVSAYKPALAFSRRIAPKLGGHFFDPRLIWKSDSELDARIRRAGLAIVPVEGCVVRHAPLSLRDDLYSSFHYGVGAGIARHLALEVPEPERSLRDPLGRGDLPAALYLLASNRLRALGDAYARTRLRLSGDRWLARISGR